MSEYLHGLPAAFSVFGLPEGISVALCVAAGFLAFPLLFVLYMMLDDWRIARSGLDSSADWRDELSHPDGRADAGVILCDYVDEQRLASIARQKGIEPEPNRRERGSTTSRGGEIGAQTKGISGKIKRDRASEEREYFDVEKDPNTALVAVLGYLENEGALSRNVGHVPPFGLDDETLELVRAAQSEVSTDDLRDSVIVMQKLAEWGDLVEGRSDPFVLVESEWSVTEREGTGRRLELLKLRPPYLAYDGEMSANEEGSPVPKGLRLVVDLPVGATVGDRLADAPGTVKAGVLATVAHFDASTGLRLRPIAVFSRHR